MAEQLNYQCKFEKYNEELIRLRRHFHRHPELGLQEFETSAFIQEYLGKLGYRFRIVEPTGIIAEHPCQDEAAFAGKKKVVLRAEMDALPIQEQTGLSYASENAGVMHACGHDNHITMVLGAARLLAQRKDELKGKVRLIFQPSEELSPQGGSRKMIEAGALKGVDAVFGLHVWPDLPLGKVGIKAGPLMAASDHFTVTIKGKPSHAARPDEGIDALVAGAQFVMAAQTIVSRNADPMKSVVITIGRLNAGTRYNIIAGECVLEGTCRTFDPAVRDLAERRLDEILSGVCTASGCTGELHYERGYMAVVNDTKMADYVRESADKILGNGTAVSVEPAMTSEDFSFYLDEKPGVFAWIGTTPPGDIVWPLHSSHYSPDEGVLWRGSALLAGLALGLWEKQQVMLLEKS